MKVAWFESREVDDLKHQDEGFLRAYVAYVDSKAHDSELINFSENIDNHAVPSIVTALREAGVVDFYISSKYPDMIETLMVFKEAGCKVSDLRRVPWNYPWEIPNQSLAAFRLTITY